MQHIADRIAQSPWKTPLLGLSPYRRQIARAYALESRLMWQPAAEVQREQESRLRDLLSLAVRAPYWKQVLDQAGKRPDQFTLADLPSLPFLTKDILRTREQ